MRIRRSNGYYEELFLIYYQLLLDGWLNSVGKINKTFSGSEEFFIADAYEPGENVIGKIIDHPYCQK